MPNLRDWQESFRAKLRERRIELPPLADSTGLGVDARMAVYQYAYWIRVSESLLEDFPLTERVLGKKLFLKAVRDFLAGYRGYAPELGALSAPFASSLADSPGLRLSAAIDLAALAAWRTPDPAPRAPGSFGLHPSVQMLGSGRRHYLIWRQGDHVMRERIGIALRELLDAFAPGGKMEEIAERLEEKALAPGFVRESVAEWSACGVIV